MTASAIPAVIDELVARSAAALPDEVTVSDGYYVGEEIGDYLMIGVEDPTLDTAARSASSEQQWAHAGGTARDETGDVTCAVMSWNGETGGPGGTGPKKARDAAFAIVAAVSDVCRTTPDLGRPEVLLWTRMGRSVELLQNQGEDGSTALVVFKVQLRARL